MIQKYWAIFRTQLLNSFAYPGDLASRSLSIVIFMWVFVHLWRATYRSAGQQSIAGLTRWLGKQGISTATGKSRWDRSTIWGMLRNPAYCGRASFGKTRRSDVRAKVTRAVRRRGKRVVPGHTTREQPRTEWIEIPVPPIVVCASCGYSYYRTSTRTSKRKLYYYRCLGSDDYRYEHGRVCSSRPVRQDYLDELVWRHVMKLLADPGLIRNEIDRRLQDRESCDSAEDQVGA